MKIMLIHCLGLGHETMVCTLCLSIFLWRDTKFYNKRTILQWHGSIVMASRFTSNLTVCSTADFMLTTKNTQHYTPCVYEETPLTHGFPSQRASTTESISMPINHHDIDELVQERRNSIANALELRLSCTNPSWWSVLIEILHPETGPKFACIIHEEHSAGMIAVCGKHGWEYNTAPLQ